MTDLDAKALERALSLFGDGDTLTSIAARDIGCELIRAYLTAIGYDAQRDVVEAAREWVAAKTPDRAIAGYRRLSAAVAAWNRVAAKEPGHDR